MNKYCCFVEIYPGCKVFAYTGAFNADSKSSIAKDLDDKEISKSLNKARETIAGRPYP